MPYGALSSGKMTDEFRYYVGIMSVLCRFNVSLMSVYRMLKFVYSIENKTFTNKTMSDVSNIEKINKKPRHLDGCLGRQICVLDTFACYYSAISSGFMFV